MQQPIINKDRKKTSVGVYVLDALIISGTLLTLLWAVGYARPLIIAPLDNTVSNSSVLFSVSKGDTLLIDETPAFSSPQTIHLDNTTLISLKPGVYYW